MSVQLLLRRRALTKALSPIAARTTITRRSVSSQLAPKQPPQDANTGVVSSTVQQQVSGQQLAYDEPLQTAPAFPDGNLDRMNTFSTSRTGTVDPSRVEAYLSSLHAAGLEPTIIDLERCRPRIDPSPDSRKYAQQYQALADTLCHSFTHRQLRHFLIQYGANSQHTRTRLKKLDYARAIIEDTWHWPSPVKLEQAKRDRTEMDEDTIELLPSELFLVLGPDGANLRKFTIEYDVNISMQRSPLALSARGLRQSLTRLKGAISGLRKNIVEETFSLPEGLTIPQELRQRISRFAGAYLENIGEGGLVRIVARDKSSAAQAKRFASRAVNQIAGMGLVPIVSHVPWDALEREHADVTEVCNFALYPFLSPRAVPWFMLSSGVFRVRRVAEWMLTRTPEQVAEQEGFANGLLSLYKNDTATVNLDDTLFPFLTSEDDYEVSVKACLGHVLFNKKQSEERMSFTPPLTGRHSYEKIMAWMSDQSHPTFVPSLPASLVNLPPAQQKIMYRLVYRALPPQSPPSPASPSSSTQLPLTPSHFMSLDVVFAEPKVSSTLEDGATSEEDIPSPLSTTCKQGTDVCLNVMMPNRTMDTRFTVSRAKSVIEAEQPLLFREYASQLHDYLNTPGSEARDKPDPPLSVVHQGRTYHLYNYCSVRQSLEEIPDHPDISSLSNMVVSESIVDLDSQQKTAFCEVVCTDPTSEETWSNFLRGCDALSTAEYAPPVGHSSSTYTGESDVIEL